MNPLDIVIIGGGPSGINCAIAAQQAGLKYQVLEKGMLVNALYHFPADMTFFSTSKLLEIGNVPFISHGEKPTRREALEYYRRLVQHYGLQINLYEPVEEMKPLERGGYEIQTSRAKYVTTNVIIATGFYDTPRRLQVPGEELPKVSHYYNDPHPFFQKEVLVIGARNSACDAALECYYKGAKVTMAIRGDEIHPNVKYWIRPNIVNRIKANSIKGLFNTQVVSIHEKKVVLKNKEQGTFEIDNDFVLAMTGYEPNYALLNRLGIACSEDALKLPDYKKETLESNLPGVFLAGVVCAGTQTSKLFIENTRDHAQIIVDTIVSRW
jgi:thioredoxin reductase (NADPH)